MAVWTINIGNSTIFTVVKAWYEDALNDIGIWEVCINGADSSIRAQVVAGATVSIYRGATQVVRGVVDRVENLQGGGLIVKGFNNEKELTETNCPVDSGKHTKTYLSSNSNTIFANLISEVSGWSSDVSGSTATSISAFRVSDSMSVWEGVMQLIRLTGKDFYVSRTEKKAYLTDKKGTANKFHFNESIDISDISYTESRAKASKVIVYGKSDGENQIIGSAGSGTPVISVIDKNIINTTEANARATKELALIQNSIKTYSFSVFNPAIDISLGDQGKITADSLSLSGENVDIVRILRGFDSKINEFLEVSVTNTGFRVASISRAQQVLALTKNATVSDTSMQGSTQHIEIPARINANSTYGLLVPFYIGAFYKDEAGKIRINSLTVDYDVDPYNRQFGTASGGSHDHSLASGDTESHKHSPSDAGHDHTLPTMTSTAYTLLTYFGSNSGTEAISSSGWDNICVLSFNKAADFVYTEVVINSDSWSGVENLSLRIRCGSDNSVIKTIYFNSDYGFMETFVVPLQKSTTTAISIYLDLVSPGALSYSATMYVYYTPYSHSHSISSGVSSNVDYSDVDDNNVIAALVGDSSAESVSVTIGDGIGEAGTLNATGVNIYLEYYNTGTLTWDTKHSILSTGKVIDYNVDLTNGGTYPNAEGWWRVRITTNSANSDLVQGIVKIKHHIDS